MNFGTNYLTLVEAEGRVRSDEDEDETDAEGNALVCTACGEDEHEDDSVRCRMCGARLRSIDDEAMRRSRTDEGRVIGRDDVNDLGKGRPDTPKRAESAVSVFKTNYRESSRVPRRDFGG